MASSAANVIAGEPTEIRRAGVEDAADAARLLHDFNTEYDDPTPPVEVLAERVRELLAGEEVVVLLTGEEPLGIALFRVRPSLWSNAADVYLEELYVVPAHRGRGIGGALLDTRDRARPPNGRQPLRADHRRRRPHRHRSLRESESHQSRKPTRRPRMLYYELDL